MTRIALIPWIEGTRSACRWEGGYTASRIRWIVRELAKSAPSLPIYVATPHADADLWPARIIDCKSWLRRHKLVECGVMAAAFHPDLEHLDVDLITADTLVLRDPREVMPDGIYSAPRQHLATRPFGDWFVHYPANHPIRAKALRAFTANPGMQAKFDKYMVDIAQHYNLLPTIIEPPIVINGEWIYEGWKPWCQPLTSETAAVHPHSHSKWPEFAETHAYFSHLPDRFAQPLPPLSWPDCPDVPKVLA
jgi:hypothetical protein